MPRAKASPSSPEPVSTSGTGSGIRDHLGLIAELTREFVAANDYKTVAHTALERITKYVCAEAASLFLVSDDGESLVCSACYGPVDITGLNISVGTGVVGRSVATREGVFVRDVRQEKDFGAAVDAKTGFTTRSLIVAPLTVGRDCLGAIEIINRLGGDGLFDHEDLVLLETLARAAALAMNNFRLTQKLVQQEREQHELELAAEIQRDLLPQPAGRDFPIHGINIPARSVSGDFFDIMPLPDGRIWFNVGDVSGKGMNAALLMAKTSSLFRCLAKSSEDPGQLLNAINNELCETNSRGMFVTMLGGLFHPGSGRLWLTNAGHEPPLHFDLRTERFKAIPADGPPLGIAPGIAGPDGFPVTEINLEGGALYVFTDGLTEATTFGGGMLGIDGARVDSRTCRRSVRSQVEEHRGGGEIARPVFARRPHPPRTAVIELEVVVRKVRGNQVLIAKTYRGEAPASAGDIDATVGSFGKAMDKILADFLRDLAALPKA